MTDNTGLHRCSRERDLLAKAIADAAIKTGGYNGEVGLTGPHLLMLLDDMVEEILRLREMATAPPSTPSPQHISVASRPLPYGRDTLGRFVREAWVRWAETQPSPKPSWLVPYDELSEPDKEADRQIGEAIARWTLIGDAARLSQVEDRLKNIEATADAISSPYRMSIIRKQALLALAILGQAPSPPSRESP